MSDSCDSIIYLDSGSDSDFGDDPLPSDTWAYGMYRTRGAHRVEMACGAHAGPARPRSTVGKSATKHIFNSVENFNSDPKACETFKHDGDQRDRFDWKFEDTEPHFTTHGPFFLELSASEDNHILDTYCTSSDTCFIKDWAGKRRYGNPPFDHDNILKCLQKALGDFDMDPANTKFMFVLPEWVTASWWHLTTHFSIVHEYPAGAKIFSAPMASCYNVANLEPCGEDPVWIEDTKLPVVVLFKDSQTVEQLDLEMPQHVRLAHIGDKSDTCGPFRISASGYRWFALFVDDSTTWICIYFLKHKSDYLEAFKLYLVEVKRLRSGMGFPEDYHTILHTDGDNTMIAGHTTAFCKERGIEQRHGSPYLHANQARVERSHRDVQAMAKALLLTSGFGVEMWPLAARHAVFILNRIFRKSLDWTSAYYLIYKKHADLSQLRIFGCLAYPFIEPTVREHKLSNRARELRYVGHSEVSSANLLYAHDSDKVVNSGMVTFSERLDKLGKVVTTWDPSAPVPLKTNFMATARDSPYRDPLPTLLETPFLEQGVYLPEDGDEVMAVVKGDSEEAMLCGRAVEPHAQAYCVVLLINFTVMDLPAGHDEVEALVQIKGARLMMKEEDVPAGVKLLDMSLILKMKLD
ncbi:hypothetical protein CYMTET_6877 [Cymbomonas tetramitiformis]|uniref:Integrase catalytic domain-containing protein n=1 Tax=Cymbomonas tetramitiformis TaxID=36881 RepID=A0AAE0GWJ7_9CHLO|nr:hypothetical protein CYMTET_6877 [Cymbomonas tetramitiformis]